MKQHLPLLSKTGLGILWLVMFLEIKPRNRQLWLLIMMLENARQKRKQQTMHKTFQKRLKKSICIYLNHFTPSKAIMTLRSKGLLIVRQSVSEHLQVTSYSTHTSTSLPQAGRAKHNSALYRYLQQKTKIELYAYRSMDVYFHVDSQINSR